MSYIARHPFRSWCQVGLNHFGYCSISSSEISIKQVEEDRPYLLAKQCPREQPGAFVIRVFAPM